MVVGDDKAVIEVDAAGFDGEEHVGEGGAGEVIVAGFVGFAVDVVTIDGEDVAWGPVHIFGPGMAEAAGELLVADVGDFAGAQREVIIGEIDGDGAGGIDQRVADFAAFEGFIFDIAGDQKDIAEDPGQEVFPFAPALQGFGGDPVAHGVGEQADAFEAGGVILVLFAPGEEFGEDAGVADG